MTVKTYKSKKESLRVRKECKKPQQVLRTIVPYCMSNSILSVYSLLPDLHSTMCWYTLYSLHSSTDSALCCRGRHNGNGNEGISTCCPYQHL